MGTLSTANTLTRDQVDASSNSNALVTFNAGTKYCSISVTGRMVKTMGQALATAMGLNMP